MIITKRRRNFILIYWGVVTAIVIFLCYRQGREELDKCRMVKGKVIDQINLPTGRGWKRRYVLRPQIIFPVEDTSYIFTDEKTTYANDEVVNVLYRKDSPRDAKVYTFWHWVDFGIVVPFFLIAGFVFAIIRIGLTNYGKKPIMLPGEFD